MVYDTGEVCNSEWLLYAISLWYWCCTVQVKVEWFVNKLDTSLLRKI